jgi:MSHA biogenesis protein MshL
MNMKQSLTHHRRHHRTARPVALWMLGLSLLLVPSCTGVNRLGSPDGSAPDTRDIVGQKDGTAIPPEGTPGPKAGEPAAKTPDNPASEYRKILENADKRRLEGKDDPLPKGIADALVPAFIGKSAQKDAKQKNRTDDRRIDLVMSEGGVIPARDLFMSLVDGTQYTMIIHPDVDHDISVPLTLVDVTVQEAVDTVCAIYGFDCSFTESKGRESWGTFRVFPRQLTSRTYRIDSLALVRTGSSSVSVNSSSQEDSGSGGGGGGGGASAKGNGANISTNNEADFWLDLENSLRVFLRMNRVARDKDGNIKELTAEQGGGSDLTKPEADKDKSSSRSIVSSVRANKSVLINRQAGLVTVTAYPEELRDVEIYLRNLNRRSQRQIILEAKIVEVQLNDGFQFGVDWTALHKGLSGYGTVTSQPSDPFQFVRTNQQRTVTTDPTTGAITSNVDDWSTSYTPTGKNPMAVMSKAANGGAFSLAIRASSFVTFLNLLQSQGKVQMLSSPRVSTMNNQKAVIKVGQDEYFITDIESERTDAGTTSTVSRTTITPTFKQFFSGVALDIIPQISEEGVITLHVHPVVSEVSLNPLTFTMDGVTNTYPLAKRQTREVDSIVRVRDGDVVIIGGLMKRGVEDTDSKVPLLGDLPLLGPLFTHTNRSIIRSELVVLIRPTVVDSGQDWAEQVSDSMRRVNDMAPTSDPVWWAR